MVSNVGTATYDAVKYLATLLSPLTSSEYNIKKNYNFLKSIKNTKNPITYKMISYDFKNLFTNVPSEKTIKIILTTIYQERILDTKHPTKGNENTALLMHKTCPFELWWENIYKC